MFGSHYCYFVQHNLACRFGKKRAPLLAGFKITHRCNLRCRACPFWRRPAEDIGFDQAIDVLDRFIEAGARLLVLEGGEPFLWRDGNHSFNDLVLEAQKRFFAVGVTTNGTLPLDTPADIVWVSIDGLRETHNLNRGPTFDKVIGNIEASRHEKILANITISQLNVDELPVLVPFLSNIPKIKGITIQFYYPYSDCEDLSISPVQRVRALDQLIRLKRAGYAILDSVAVLEALKENRWKCHDWLIADAEPDGTITLGCYLKNRADIDCRQCGFAAHAELSLAFEGNLSAINTGRKVFGFK